MAGNYNFKEETGEMQFDAQGNLKVNIQAGAGSGGTSATDDAAFTAGSGSGTPMMGFVTADAVDSGDVGVVGMLANRQLKVTLYDSAGAELAVGGGTQYTEDAASAANPTGTVPMLVRQDTPASEVSTNGDNIAQRATQYGAAYTQIVSSTGSFIDTFGGGTQYTEGDTDATITGTAMLMEGAGNALVVAQGTAADGLLVNLGSNNDVTVTGTVTANLAAGTNNIGDVDVLSVPAPLSTTGGGTEATALRVTIANDSTGVVSIDDNGGAITVDGSVTVSATNLDIRDLVAASDAVSVHGDVGILDQLDLTNSNPAVVAIVDSNGDQITSFGGGTQYTEDAAAAANPVGTAVNLVRQDTPATLVSTDGDNVAQRGTNYGAAYVQVVSSSGSFIDTFGGGTQYTEGDTDATITGTAMMMEGGGNALVAAQGTAADGLLVNLGANNDVTVSGVSTLAEQQTQTTHLATIAGDTTDIEAAVELIDDTVATLGTTTYLEATTKGLIIGAVRRDADTTLVDTTNEVSPLQVDANGRLKVEVFSGETLPVSLTSTTITGTVTVDSELPAAETPADNLTNATAAPRVNSLGYVFDGSAWDRSPGNSADGALVNLGANNDVTVTNATAANLKNEPAGNIAHDAIDSGNPIKIGAKVETSLEGITAVADGDRTDLYADADGQILVKPLVPFGDIITERVTDTGGTSTAFTNFNAGGAGVRNYVTTITVYNSSSTDGFLDIRDGAAGSVIHTIPLPQTSGATITFNVPLRQTTANTALAYDVSAAITTVYISVVGFQSKL